MSDIQVLHIVSGALGIAAKLAMPMLLATLVIGTLVSVIQTVTQIQEQSLAFVPKLVAVGAIVMFGGNWMMREVTTWVTQLWSSIPTLV